MGILYYNKNVSILANIHFFWQQRKWTETCLPAGREITAPARAVANSCRGLAKITKNDVAPKRHE